MTAATPVLAFDPLKRCTKCRAEKPTTEFYAHPTQKSGLHPRCKECVKEASRERLSGDRERINAERRSRWAERHPNRKRGVIAARVAAAVPKLCECGCGQLTSIVKESNGRRGLVAGDSYRFIKGHSGRLANPDPGYTVDQATGCWLYNGHVRANGYAGMLTGPAGKEAAHRVHYRRVKGPIPKGLTLDHLCRVRRCVNPDHLEPVTVAVNNRRGLATRLTEEQVSEIKRRVTNVRGSHTALAREFGVSRPAISLIAEGKRWSA